MEFNNYSSHLSVFEKILNSFKTDSVLEFGLGEYSTPFFAQRCRFVVSIEQESKDWFEKIKAKINAPAWYPVFQRDPKAVFKYFDDKGTKFDLVFSDGLTETRCLVANMAIERNVPIVVLHDVEKIWYYRWNLLNIPANYSRFDFRCQSGVRKITTVLTNQDANIIEKLSIPGHDRVILAYSSPSQPIVQITIRGNAIVPSDISLLGSPVR
jgi:hypothetical protein